MVGQLRFSTELGVNGDGSPCHAVATDGTYLAFAVPGSPDVEVHRLGGPAAAAGGSGPRPVRLMSELQLRPVIAMTFGVGPMGTSDPTPRRGGSGSGSGRPTVLFCGSCDAVVAWNLSAVWEAVAGGHPPPPPVQVMSDPGPVYCLAHSGRLAQLVVGAGPDVHVFDVRTFRHIYRLDGHAADVLAAAFCPPPGPAALLVTAGADRTFKIWDLQAGSLVMQSSVLGAAPLTALALEASSPPRLALGAADGVLRFFDLSSLPAARLLQTVDVGRQLGKALAAAAAAAAEAAAAATAGPKVISSRPNWKAQMGLQRQASSSGSELGGGGGGGCDDEEGGLGTSSDALGGGGGAFVLQLAYSAAPPPPPQPHDPLHDFLPDVYSAAGGGGGAPPPLLLPGCPSLLVATPGAVVVVDTRSYEVTEAFLLGRTGDTAAAAPPPPPPPGRQRSGEGGALTAAPPPPPLAARSRLALRGVPRAEPCGAAALAAPVGAAVGSGGGGMVCVTAAAREPTVAVLTYEPSEAAAAAASGNGGAGGGVAALAAAVAGGMRLQRTPSASSTGSGGGRGAGGGAATRLRFSGSGDGDAGGGAADGGYGYGADGGASTDDVAAAPAAAVLSVYQTTPLPENSPLRAPSPAGPGPGSAGSNGGGGGARRSSSAGPRRPSGSGGSAGASPGGKAGGGGPGRFASPGRALGSGRPPLAAGRSGGGGDKPVTFHAKVKSSGYGVLQPSTQLGRAPPPPVKLAPRAAAASAVNRHMAAARAYPLDCGPLLSHQTRNTLPGGAAAHPGGAIVRVAYSSDAGRLLTASVNRTARVLKLPLSRWGGEGTDLLGHGGPLHGADWSREGTLALTASADRTARLWDAACAQPLLEISHLHHQPPARPTGPGGAPAMPPPAPPSPAAAAKSPNPPLQHEVRAARFVYMDQFIALAAGNKLLLYRYKLAGEPDSDIERLRARHSYRLVGSHTSSAQTLTDFSALNCFLSPLAVTAASHRGLELVDLAVMRPVAAVAEAHSRPVGCVAQAGSASLFAAHPREAAELFATSAPDNAVKLWDVRAPSRCVRAFAGHKNSQLPAMGVAFSPCLRYLGVGSEDKQAVLYDLRQGVVAHKVGRGVVSDAVTAVAFNPLHPQMALACLDGKIAFFSDGAA
ncbi:hypothetical protein CHLRE_02g100800v5 [Chlamydomonas reinhardtii]|uniref:Uncharacterized protein n=1 Tax=Chlamydomonas reinhardtii TaxID=3055 RepID=A0A2K3E2A3_CHLRE|nr:uncharacterized protein CHLRE_02g100800v5 [Chlamydomonas reinhardtii]PNW86908.1 hypothetical protein CHLRE_02g100800v5 [Chlamydomonas reinhardtii]